MIHYHGTPIGGARADVPRFLHKRNALVSFASPCDLGTALEVCRSVVLDNGAFSVWRQGGTLDVAGYVDWVTELAGHPRVAYAMIPDVIEGSESANDDLIDRWPHWLRRVGCPVWHLHESLYRLERLAVEWPIVAFGSSGQFGDPGSPAWWRRMDMALSAICDERGRPRVRIHGLRMLRGEIVRRVPLYAADSTNAAQNGHRDAKRHGLTTVQGQVIRADRIESVQSAESWQPREAWRQVALFP